MKEERFSELFKLLDPEQLGEKFRQALAAGERKDLIRETARYFRNRPEKPYCRNFDRSGFSPQTAERALRGDVTVINIPHCFPENVIDWRFNPTFEKPPVNHEWLWQLNRMTFWLDMCYAYEKSGDERYAAAFNSQLASWVACAGDFEEFAENTWNSPGSLWRTIETGLRLMYAWCLAFEIFRKSPSFTDENICLMLCSMYRQALHLRKNHRSRTNWLLMEMSGLYTFSALFPEFTSALSMRKYAAEKFTSAVMEQILPDGLHDELSPDYHTVLLSCAAAFCRIAEAEKTASELPPEFMAKLESSYASALAMSTPALCSPRTNDSFTCSVSGKMKQALAFFPHNKEFLWAASQRREGSEPASVPSASRFLPWGGFAVMRSDWGPEAAYCSFDAGPLGAGHMHQDKLNINIYKGSEELIFDDGGGQYEHSVYRAYGVSSADHNTVLVDGLLQRRSAPKKLEGPADVRWISNEKFDYARSSYDSEFGPMLFNDEDAALPLTRPAKHTREVCFFKPDFFCVRDICESLDGKEHTYELRFHLDTLKMKQPPSLPGAWLSDFGRRYDILVIPLFPEESESRVISGADLLPMGGWFVGRNDQALHACSTLTVTVAGKKNCRFATLLIPLLRNAELPVLERGSDENFVLHLNNRKYCFNIGNLENSCRIK